MQRTGFKTSREDIGRPAPRGYIVHNLDNGVKQRFASYYGAERQLRKLARATLTLVACGERRILARVG